MIVFRPLDEESRDGEVSDVRVFTPGRGHGGAGHGHPQDAGGPYVQTALGPSFNTGGQAHKGSLLASGMTICSQKSAHRKFAAENETRSQGRLGPSARASFPLWRQWSEVGMIRNAPGTRIMKPPRYTFRSGFSAVSYCALCEIAQLYARVRRQRVRRQGHRMGVE